MMLLILILLPTAARAVENDVYTLFEDASLIDVAMQAVPYAVDTDVSHIRYTVDSILSALKSGSYNTVASLLSDLNSKLGGSVNYISDIRSYLSNMNTYLINNVRHDYVTSSGNIAEQSFPFAVTQSLANIGSWVYDINSKISSGYAGLTQSQLNSSLQSYVTNHLFTQSELNSSLSKYFSSVLKTFNIFNSDGVIVSSGDFFTSLGTNFSTLSQSLQIQYNTLRAKTWASYADDFTIVYDSWWVTIWRGVNMMRTIGMDYFYKNVHHAFNSNGTLTGPISWAASLLHNIYSMADVLTHWVDPDRVKLTESSRDSVKVVTDQIYGSGSSLSPSGNIGSAIGSAGDTVGLFGDASAAGGLGDAIDGVVSTDNGFAWFSAATRDNLDSSPQTFDLDPDSEDFTTHYYEDNRDEVLSFFSALGG